MTSSASLPPQLLSHPAIVLCEPTMPSRVVPEILATVEFCCVFECRGGLVLTVCGSAEALGSAVQAIGCRSECCLRFSARPLGSSFGKQDWLCGPQVPALFGLGLRSVSVMSASFRVNPAGLAARAQPKPSSQSQQELTG
jgi:hypothetical protein